jgi:CheY-like chemotaxis protein
MCRILVVDDELECRAALCAVFEDEGFETAAAADGYQAIDSLLKHRPDLIVSDIAMPNLDGIRLVELLRTQGVQVPVILLTAGPTGRRHRAEALLAKPFSVDALLDTVAHVLSDGAEATKRPAPR